MARFLGLRPVAARPTRITRRPSASLGYACHRPAHLPSLELLEDRTLLSVSASSPLPLAIPLVGGSPSPVGLTPLQVVQAYGFNAIAFQGGIDGDGSGQTIAIVDAFTDPTIASDLAQFDAKFSLPAPSLTIAFPDGPVQNAPGPSRTDAPWGQETALDVEWAHALAPGAAILLVETPNTDQGLLDGVIYARSRPAVSVISMSWTESSIRNDAIFTTPPGHQGITFVAATGDDGAQAGYPASSENVLAVGGTEFSNPLDSSGDYPAGGEVAWDGASGGVDPNEPQLPAQQLAIGTRGGRATPDVAFDAHSSVAVYDSYDYGATPWVAVIGTSIGAPAWSSLVAIADQGLSLAGQSTMDGATQTLTALYAIARSGNESAGFNDVTAGANFLDQAGPGFDGVTGLGTPKAAYIAAALSNNVDSLALISPAPQAVVGTTTPTFRWSAVAGAAGYNLTVTDTVTGQVVISRAILATNSYTPPATSPLTSGDAFTWGVSVVTAHGTTAPNAPTPTPFAVLPTPVPSVPSGVTDSTSPTFQWSKVDGVAGYNLQVVDTNTGQTVINAQGVATNSYIPSTPLVNLHTYQWVVSATSAATYKGIPYTSPSSGSAYFTVSIPDAPTPVSPRDQSIVVPPTTTLQWTSVPGAVSYTVTLANYFYGTTVATVDTTSWITPSLSGLYSSASQYSWFVQANINVGGGVTILGPASRRSTFNLGTIPDPALLSPLPYATVTTPYPLLQWSAVSGVQYGYDLSLLDLTSGESLLNSYQDQTGTSFQVGFPLLNGHSYEWSVSAEGNPGLVGTTSQFTVSLPGGGAQSLAAPVPIGPDGLTGSIQPVFTWQPVSNATGYVLFLSRDGQTPIFLPVVTSQTAASPNLDGIASVGTVYNWWVMAYDAAGNYSPPSRFVDFAPSLLQNGQFATPTGLSPSGVVTTMTSPVFQWQGVSGSPDYGFTIVDETTGATVAGRGGNGETTYTPNTFGGGSPLIAGHQYRWYVGAYNGNLAQNSQEATARFVFNPTPDDTPLPASPAQGSVVGTTTPGFQWSAVPGAAGYYLYISDPNQFSSQELFLSYAVKVGTNSYVPSNPLLDDHTYAWQVSAYFLVGGVEVSGPTFVAISFTTSVPGTPSLVANGGSGTLTTATPKLNWSPVAGAAGYDLYLVDATTAVQVFAGLPVVTTSFAIAQPLDNDTYRWYVTAFDNVGDVGLAPPALTFTVAVSGGGLPTATLTGPTGKTKLASPIFQWTSVPGAVGYSLSIQDTTTGKPVVSGLSIHGLMYVPPTPLPANDAYSWYVRAIYGNGTIGPKPAAAVFDVSTTSDLAGPPIPLAPIGQLGVASPRFQWSSVANAVAYEFEVFATIGNQKVYALTPTTVVGTTFTPSLPLQAGLVYTWQVAALDSTGQQSAYSNPLTFRLASGASRADFDGDGKSEIAVFQPSTSTFFVMPSSGTIAPYAAQFGLGAAFGGNPIPIAGDFDGDGRTDVAIFQPSTSTFFVLPSSGARPYAAQFGQGANSGGNPLPIAGDFDGDGRTDVAIFQPATSTFFVLPSSGARPYAAQFGQGTATGGHPEPVVGDFDGDGRTDVAIFQPSTSTFFVLPSSGARPYAAQFGQGANSGGNPLPIAGDFDGDGRTDVAIFQPATSTFFVLPSSGARPYAAQFGQGTATGGHPEPVVGDFDGDGRTDVAVFQPATSTFFISPASAQPRAVQFGLGTLGGGNPVPLPVPPPYASGGVVSVASVRIGAGSILPSQPRSLVDGASTGVMNPPPPLISPAASGRALAHPAVGRGMASSTLAVAAPISSAPATRTGTTTFDLPAGVRALMYANDAIRTTRVNPKSPARPRRSEFGVIPPNHTGRAGSQATRKAKTATAGPAAPIQARPSVGGLPRGPIRHGSID